jgi:hypothetical protein
VPSLKRKKKWGVLEITDLIRGKLSKFENKSPLVDRTVKTFEALFETVEQFEDSVTRIKTQTVAVAPQQSHPPPQPSHENDDPDLSRVQVNLVGANDETSYLDEILNLGHFFQHMETLMTYGILLFSNEADVLNPLLDLLDECARILSKFNSLHVVYKIVCGKNYLSKLRVVIKKILELAKNSKLKFNSPVEFIAELKTTYPNLLYMLIQSASDGKGASNGLFDLVPDKFKHAFGDVMNKLS